MEKNKKRPKWVLEWLIERTYSEELIYGDVIDYEKEREGYRKELAEIEKEQKNDCDNLRRSGFR